jgi:DNA-binding CsgD family transcriptional regulator
MTHPSVEHDASQGLAVPLFGSAVAGRQCRLTPQETQVLALLVQGHYKKTAADVLGISVNTVSFHLKNIYAKLQVHSKTEAVVKALVDGLLPVPTRS